MNLIRGRVWLLLSLALGVARLAGAQVAGGELTGLVTDPMRSPVSGAMVTATNSRTGVVRTAVTNSTGVYVLPGLAPGLYAVDLMLSGFRGVHHEDVRVTPGVTVRLDVALVVGNMSEAVTVTAATPALRASASLGQVVSE